MPSRREPVSIVCVFNNEKVRQDCLDRSLALLISTAPRTEFVPVDNRGQRHATAGSALNLGAKSATRDFVAFVQQDVFLHSLVALEEAAGRLANDPRWGMLGAVGISSDGRILGRVRDRVALIGNASAIPTRVDSLDEVLFLVRRSSIVADPLSESPDLAWHAYAIEYGLRLREAGLEIGAVDIPITHNSLSTNLARLDEAHAAVARMHPRLLPTRTTCGTVTASPRPPLEQRFLAEHRWRLRWLSSSWAARQAYVASGSNAVLLSDIRRDIAYALAASGDPGLRIHNVTPEDLRFPDGPDGTHLHRGDHAVHFTSGPLDPLGSLDPGASLLLTNVSLTGLRRLAPSIRTTRHVIGYHRGLSYWVALGPAATGLASLRLSARARPSRLLVRL